jgi:hypothetical protein
LAVCAKLLMHNECDGGETAGQTCRHIGRSQGEHLLVAIEAIAKLLPIAPPQHQSVGQ